MTRIIVLATLAALMYAPQLSAQVSGNSPTCGPVNGKTTTDRDNALAFCAKGIVKGAVVGVIAMESLLWVKVSREMADAMRIDRLSTEQIIKVFMSGWKQHSGSRAVTVYVEWQDVEIARGETTIFSGDQVTIR